MYLQDINSINQLPTPALGLLPAVHDATVTETATLPESPAAGNVWTATADITLPASGRWPARILRTGHSFAYDGRLFYRVQRRLNPADPAETSWYPTAFERTLYTVHLTPQQLVVGGNFRLERQFEFRLIGNTTNAVWSVFFEVGMRSTQTTPAPIGPNLLDYTWLPPLLEHQAVITDVLCAHQLGIQIWNTASGYQASRLRYDRADACPEDSLPTAADFAIRLRLGCFDTQNSITDLRGYAAFIAKDLN